MPKILLVRHGETEWNKIKKVMGHLHIPLNDNGVKQVTVLAEMLKDFPISAVYASPLKRTMETARIIADHHNLPVTEEKRIIEIDFGEWTGKNFCELKDDPLYQQFYETPGDIEIPGGETIIDAQKRGVISIEEVNNSCGGENVVMVSHCDIIRIILAHYMRIDSNNYRTFAIDNASLSIIDFNTNKAVVSLINYLCDIERII